MSNIKGLRLEEAGECAACLYDILDDINANSINLLTKDGDDLKAGVFVTTDPELAKILNDAFEKFDINH